MLDLSVLSAGKRALYRAELRDAKLLGEVRVERDLRTPGIDEEGDFVAAVYAHANHRQRIGLYELQTRTRPVAMQFIRSLALEALQLRNVQVGYCEIISLLLLTSTPFSEAAAFWKSSRR